MKKELLLTSIISIFISILLMGGVIFVFSWNEPSRGMPAEYQDLLNTGEDYQYKAGEIGSVLFRDVEATGEDTGFYLNPSGNSLLAGKIETDYQVTNKDSRNTLVTKDYVDGLLAGMYPTRRLVGTNPLCPARYYSQRRNYDSRVCTNTYSLPNSAYGVADYCGRTTVTKTCTAIGGWSPAICSYPAYCCSSSYSNHVYYHTTTGSQNYKCINNKWSENECVLVVSEDDHIISRTGVEERVSDDCVNAQGEMVKVTEGFICRFQQSSCPTGWTQYKNWSATTPNFGTCSTSVFYVSGAHLWANTPVEISGTAKATITEIGCY